MDEGWYLMSAGEIERALRAWREAEDIEIGIPLWSDDALRFRNEGNLLDEAGRSLRLVLRVGPGESVEERRKQFEPDFHDEPAWRREGSKPVNVVPLPASQESAPDLPWWDQADVHDLEAEWRRSGRVAGLVVPAEYRSFVLKTVVSLSKAGLPVTPDSIADSISRWLDRDDAERIRAALKKEEPGG